MVSIVPQSAEIKSMTSFPLEEIESVGRDCYLSGDKIGPGTAEAFVKMIMSKEHGALLEFADARVRCVTNRAIANELVRHRIASYAQESTRYCNYNKEKFGGEIKVIQPFDISKYSMRTYTIWVAACDAAQEAYLDLISNGVPPEVARDVLPLCTATVINIKASFREWGHILNLRFLGKAGKPHAQMKELMGIIAPQLAERCPTVFNHYMTQEGR